MSSTPPPVQSTVPVGTTLSGATGVGTSPSAGQVMSDGHSMPGMSMPGTSVPTGQGTATPSTVPNGTGSYAVPAPNVDGCNRAYGVTSQCVPLRAPGGRPVTCAFLRSYRYLPLLVTRDPLHLLSGGGTTARVTGGKTYLTGCSA